MFGQCLSRARWSSGYPRMLLALVRELKSHRGEIVNSFAQIRKDQLLRAPSVGGRIVTRASRRGKKGLKLFSR